MTQQLQERAGSAKLDERTRDMVVWRIDDLRLKHKDVAAFLGVSAGQFSKLLSGTRSITDDQRDKLIRVLGLDERLVVVKAAA